MYHTFMDHHTTLLLFLLAILTLQKNYMYITCTLQVHYKYITSTIQVHNKYMYAYSDDCASDGELPHSELHNAGDFRMIEKSFLGTVKKRA